MQFLSLSRLVDQFSPEAFTPELMDRERTCDANFRTWGEGLTL
jgi:hypothetical protein